MPAAKRLTKSVFGKRHYSLSTTRLGLLFGLFVLTWLFWNTTPFYPLRILVTVVHELGHGFGAIFTGGSIEKIIINPDTSGLAYTRGGLRLIIIPAGYLGSMLFGCACLIAAARSDYDREINLALGILLAGCALLFIRSQTGLLYAIGMGIGLGLAGRFASRDANDFLLSFIGMTSCLYSLLDFRYLIVSGSEHSDAASFAKEVFPLPPAVWATIWSVIAVIALLYSIRIALRE